MLGGAGAALGTASTGMPGLRIVQLDLARQMETIPFIKGFIDRVAEVGYDTLQLYLEAPKAIASTSGAVRDAGNVLVDDFSAATFGRPGFLAAFRDKELQEAVSSITIELAAYGSAR